MKNYKKGDRIKVVDEDVVGEVIEVGKNDVTILDEFGFEQSYPFQEIIPDVGFEEEITSTKDNEESIKEPKVVFDLEESKIEEKKLQDLKSTFQETPKKKKEKKKKEPLVIDLHYTQLENYDSKLERRFILQRQVNAAKRAIENARAQRENKIIIIHGKGKGVFQKALYDLFDSMNLTYYDADFQIYKLGATTVEL